MDEDFYSAAYRGSKSFSQDDIRTANATGFGAAADDYMERGIDLNEQLIMNKPATFFFRMQGDAMMEAGINEDDILVVDRSIKPANGKVIVAAVDGELMVRTFQQDIRAPKLFPANKRLKPIEIGEFSNYQAWGVVTCVIHMLDPALLAHRNNQLHKTKKNRKS